MSASSVVKIHALRQLLIGDRVLVRPFTKMDISDIYLGWLLDPEVVRFSNQRFRTHTRKSCQDYLFSFSDTPDHFLAICERGTNAILGTMTVYHNIPHGTADIGIMIGERKVWGLGVGTEAFSLVLSALQYSGKVRKVTAGAVSINRGMLRIFEKSGLHHEATRVAQELIDGEPVDVAYYAKFFYG
jgi:ribosomal-protein-alanine N-acetyltransferase